MSLRLKTALAVTMATALLFGGALAVAWHYVGAESTGADHTLALDRLERCLGYMHHLADDVDSSTATLAGRWAVRQALASQDEPSLAAFMSGSTLPGIRAYAFIDVDGDVLFVGSAEPSLDPPKWLAALSDDAAAIASRVDRSSRLTGLIQVGSEALIVSSDVVYSTEDSTTVVGTIVGGQVVDPEDILDVTDVPVSILTTEGADVLAPTPVTQLPGDADRASWGLTQEAGSLRATANLETLDGSTLRLSAPWPMSASQRVRDTMNAFALVVVPAGMLVTLALVFLLDRAVIARVQKLARHMREVGQGDEHLVSHLERPGDDISHLEQEMESMLARLARQESDLRAARDRLESDVELRTAELREAYDELVRANRAKDAFLANMSHELRTPMNSILGFSGVLLTGEPGPLTDEQTRQLEMVSRSANHLRLIIDDLLDLAAATAGNIAITPIAVDIESLCNEVAVEATTAFGTNNVPIAVEIDSELTEVVTDITRFRQILSNLLVNALKFTHEGSVTLRVFSSTDGTRLVVEVSDTGVGIAPEYLEHIFEEFYQLPSAVAAKSPGLGLGLPLSRRLAQLMGGDLAASSKVGKGSTFTVTLPRQLEQ